jgi:hypothetical protein
MQDEKGFMIRRNTLSAIQISLAIFLLLFIFESGGYAFKFQDIRPRADYASVAAQLEKFILHEMQDKKLPALSIEFFIVPQGWGK